MGSPSNHLSVCLAVTAMHVCAQIGASPSTEHFLALCAALSGPQTTTLVAFEARSDALRQAFLSCAISSNFTVGTWPAILHAARLASMPM